LAGTVTVRTGRQRVVLMRDLGRSLLELEQRADQDDVQVLDVQLVAQLCAAPSYLAFKHHWERAWRKQRAGLTVAG
jgi:hypothetical protein